MRCGQWKRGRGTEASIATNGIRGNPTMRIKSSIKVMSVCCGYGWLKGSVCVRDDTREPTGMYSRLEPRAILTATVSEWIQIISA